MVLAFAQHQQHHQKQQRWNEEEKGEKKMRSTSTNSINRKELLVALELLRKCVSKATYYCRILIDIDFCSIIKFWCTQYPSKWAKEQASEHAKQNETCERYTKNCHIERWKKARCNISRSRSRPYTSSITCRIIIIIFIIVRVSFFARHLQFIIACLHCASCKSISGMQLQNRWHFNHFSLNALQISGC